MFTISGKVAIVTGPRVGIGHAVAMAFAKAGVNVVGVGSQNLDALKQEVEACGVGFCAVTADLTKPSAELAEQIVQTAVNAFGRVDILVNNAGIARRADALDYSEQDWDDVLNINLKACFLLAQAAARQMIAQGQGGKIVNLASMLTFSGGIRVPSYAASKHGIAGITKALANEWSQYGININAVAPGYIDTPMNQAHKDNPQRLKELNERIPCGRWGTPEEVAAPILFLCTDEARYIHGAILPIDGGWMAR